MCFMIPETKEERTERRLKRFERSLHEMYDDPELIAKKLKDHRKLVYQREQGETR